MGHSTGHSGLAASSPILMNRLHLRLHFLFLPIAACGSIDLAPHGSGEHGGAGPTGEQNLARATGAQDVRAAIARLEDARSDGDGMLEILIEDADPQIRSRAALALGRLPTWRYRSVVTDALVRALDDEQADVRASAAFALGMRADAAAEPGLLAHREEPDAGVRARLVEAASKIATSAMQELVLAALSDRDPRVRIEAAEGTSRFPANPPGGAPSREQVDAALIAFARSVRARIDATSEGSAASVGAWNDPATDEEVWRALFSLARRKSAAARDLFLEELGDDSGASVWSRFFALKGLADLAPEARADDALRSALETYAEDTDWILACEAVKGLGRIGDPRSIDALELAWRNPDVGAAHVRAAVVRALASLPEATAHLQDRFDAARLDDSREVRVAAIIGQCIRFGEQDRMTATLDLLAANADPVYRRAAALGAAELPTAAGLPLLLRSTHDASFFVSTAATSALERHPSEATSLRLRELLLGEDNGLRLASAEVLEKTRAVLALEDLSEAWRRSTGDVGSEVRVQLLRLANVQPQSPERLAFVVAGLSDSDPYVRRIAHELATAMGSAAALPVAGEAAREEVPGAGFARGASEPSNPIVEIVTTRGSLTFELFPAEAPGHVESFLELARREHYDGLTFHRVEPGFVVQGGCHRGDGNGGGSAHASSLRQEIGPRKYFRGSLGMPRNDDLESGGSQFFVTHVPTPHLDGRYTIFGELRSGFDVLDSIEVGDRILDVRSR